MGVPRTNRKLAAILAADVVGYSRLMGADEEGTLAQLRGHRRALMMPRSGSTAAAIVKTTGDGMLVEFASVVDGVRCAVEVQRGMAERNAGVPQTSDRVPRRLNLAATSSSRTTTSSAMASNVAGAARGAGGSPGHLRRPVSTRPGARQARLHL